MRRNSRDARKGMASRYHGAWAHTPAILQGAGGLARVERVREAISLPLLVNGDIETAEQAREALRFSGADGVMIGRASLGRPWLWARSRPLSTGAPRGFRTRTARGSRNPALRFPARQHGRGAWDSPRAQACRGLCGRGRAARWPCRSGPQGPGSRHQCSDFVREFLRASFHSIPSARCGRPPDEHPEPDRRRPMPVIEVDSKNASRSANTAAEQLLGAGRESPCASAPCRNGCHPARP